MFGPRGNPRHFLHFCPEVSYDVFGVFASSLSEYADELDRDIEHERLGRSHAPRNDWRWQWGCVDALHYSDGPVYAPLLQKSREQGIAEEKGAIFEFKPNWHGISVNLPRLWKRLTVFFRSRKNG